MSQYAKSGSTTIGFSSAFVYNKRLQPALADAAYGTTYLYQRCYDFHLMGSLNVSHGAITCSFSTTSPGNNGNLYVVQNKLDDTRTQNFFYDSLNRVTQAYTNGPNWGQQFSIDAWGNLTNAGSVSGKNPIGIFSSTAGANNQLSCTAGCTSTYDTAGNMTTDGNGLITYDAENRISVTNGVTYTYDGDGKRVEKSNGTMYWTGVGANTLSESDLSGNINEEYVFFNGMRVSRVDRPSGNVHAFLDDHLGSSRMIVTPLNSTTLTLEEDLDYTPYGILATGTPTDHYQFTGKERDAESGLDMFGARYYGSSLGRFMTPDWAAKPATVPYAHFGNPQSLNLYSYVNNNPTTTADPDGHCPGDTPNCSKMAANPLSNVSAETKQAINNSVKASNSPTADDKKGGSHEEGGVAWTKNGTQTVAPAQPGAYKDVKQQGVVEMDPFKAANPSQQKPGDVQADVQWHVHPSAEVTETTGSQSAPGTVVFGGTVTTSTSEFKQPPSPVDIGNAGGANLNIVVGARDKTVYVYDSSGCTCKESLKDFNKTPNQ